MPYPSELKDAYLLAKYGVKQCGIDDAGEMVSIAKQIWKLVEEVKGGCGGGT